MIEFRNVSKTYDTGSRAVKNINLRIRDGEFVFFTGRSGAGKSTLIKLITRELKPTEGEIEVNGWNLSRIRQRDIPKYRRSLGVVFQDFRLLNDRNVFENIAFAQRVIGASRREIRENVPEMLKLTGLSAKYKNMPFQLSGGEQQRGAIARALVNRPSVILADEPTGNLDEKNSREIMNLLLDINRMGTTVVVITHSRELVESVGKRVIVLDRGTISEDRESAEERRPISSFFSDYRPKERRKPAEREESPAEPAAAAAMPGPERLRQLKQGTIPSREDEAEADAPWEEDDEWLDDEYEEDWFVSSDEKKEEGGGPV